MTGARPVTARFDVQTFPLTVDLTGAGAGTVRLTPPGINCTTDCTQSYASGTAVTLTATPASGSVFTGWSGACTSSPCVVSMTGARAVTARFDVQTFPLTVDLTGAGAGTVTLTATPASGSVFTGWSGACTSSPCVVSMTGARVVTARFDVQTFPLTVD